MASLIITILVVPTNFLLAYENNQQTAGTKTNATENNLTIKTTPSDTGVEIADPSFSITPEAPSEETDDPEPRTPEKTKPDFSEADSKTSSPFEDADNERKKENQDPTPLVVDGTTKEITTETDEVKKLPKTDPSTGALIYNYEFTLPPGRNDLTPDLALTYNSNDRNSSAYVGYGWSFNIPYIERQNKYGSEQIYDHNNFNSSLSGELVLDSATTDTFKSKVDNGDFLSYKLNNNSWIVYDKSGTRYIFGNTAQSRQDNSNNTNRIYKWMLEEVRDPNDNYIKYEYFKDKGQIYPSKITYTGHETTDGIFEIIFNKASHIVGQQSYHPDFLVQTDFKIIGIEIKENGEWVKKYDFERNETARILLTSITETARDPETGEIAIRSPYNFEYQVASTPSWTQTTGDAWKLPTYFYDEGWQTPSRLIQVQDVNGDGYPDVVHSNDNSFDCNSDYVYLNDTDGTWTKICTGLGDVPLDFFDGDYVYPDNGVRLFDYNGDLLPDLARAHTYEWGDNVDEVTAYTNTGTGWINGGATSPVGFIYSDTYHKDNGAQPTDVNGDGIADIILGHTKNSTFVENVYIGQGNGAFVAATSSHYNLPHTILDHENQPGYTYAQFMDINDDGLIDYAWRYINGTQICGINNGHDWDITTCIPIPTQDWNHSNPSMDMGVRSWDADGDGATDLIRAIQDHTGDVSSGFYKNYLPGLSGPISIEMPLGFASTAYSTRPGGPVVTDINADGISDLVYAINDYLSGGEYNSDVRTYLGNGSPFVDLLIGIETSSGADSSITYKLSTQYKDGNDALLNPKLPLAVTTVEKIETNDGLGNISSELYAYSNGSYYYNNPRDRKFAGFGLLEKLDSEGNVTKTYFHQGNESNTSQGEYDDHISKAGKPYRIEKYDESGNLYSKTINKWDRYDLGDDSSFVKLVDSVEFTYDGDTDHRDKATRAMYNDSNGNLSTQIEYGEVLGNDDGTFTDIGTDKFTTSFSYAISASNPAISKLSEELILDQNLNKVRERKIYYDNLSLGNLDKGNLTKEEYWVSENSYIDTEKIYNSYGLVTQEKDPRDKSTTYTYDTYNLYPEVIANPLGHTTELFYDYSSGQVVEMMDPNGNDYENIYDPFDRIIEEKQPVLEVINTPGAPTTETKTKYEYTDNVFPRKVKITNYLDDTNTVDSYTYLDGLNRKIEERIEAEESNTFKVRDFYYNSQGLLEKESLPFFEIGTSHTGSTLPNSALLTSYSYDPLGRIKTITNVLGSTLNSYDDWKIITTDPENNVKEYEKDAYSNLVEVIENEDTNQYTTNYEWNGNKNLTKIIDANGNIRNLTYDAIGRRLTAEDLHNELDQSYGTWSYEYDDAGNLETQTDPKNQIVNFTYDDLNRIKSEDYTGEAGVEVLYDYDNCTNGIGKLCAATSTGAISKFSYNPLGLVSTEIKTIDFTKYNSSYSYDRQGNLLNTRYPEGSESSYRFNTAGLLETIQKKERNGSWEDIVTNLDYSPIDQVVYKQFANDMETVYTYDETKRYRLQRILTNNPSPMLLENEDSNDFEIIELPTKKDVLVPTQTTENNPLKLKASKEKHLAIREFSDGIIQYAYISDSKLNETPINQDVIEKAKKQDLNIKGEVLSKRTKHSRTFATNKDNIFVSEIISGQPQYYKDENGEWWFVNYATTTKEIYERNSEIKKSEGVLKKVIGAVSSLFWGNLGKTVFADTSTFFPNSHPENNTVDGWVWHRTGSHGSGIDWSSIRDGIGTDSGDSAAEDTQILIEADNTTDNWRIISRGIRIFDATSIPHYDDIIAATYSESTQSKGANNFECEVNIYSSDTASSTEIVSGDFDGIGGDEDIGEPFSTTIPMGQISPYEGVYTDWDLNTNGLNNINRITVTRFGVRESKYDGANIEPTWSSQNFCQVIFNNSEEDGTSKDPKLVIIHDDGTGSIGLGDGIQDISYEYDNVGNIARIVDDSTTETAKNTVFIYDDLYRLKTAHTASATSTPFSETYDYSSIGNITSKSDQGTYTYSENGYANPHAATSIGGVSLVYDNNGNLISFGGKTYEWDWRNRMLSTEDGQDETVYSYDHTEQRVKKVTGNQTSIFPNQYFDKVSAGGQATSTKHIYDNNGGLVATVESNGTDVNTYFVHTDHLGGTNVVTDEDGEVVEVTDYLPFGKINTNVTNGSFSEARKYTGHVYDEDADLNYMNARYQDGNIGRFLSQDPAFLATGGPTLKDKTGLDLETYLSDPQNFNSYSYARNNPLKHVDESGEFVDTVVDVGFIAYDVYKITQGLVNSTDVSSDVKALGLDVGGALLPGVTGLGLTARIGNKADEIASIARSIGNVGDIAKQTNWGNPGKLIGHTLDHATDFKLQRTDVVGYAKAADSFISQADAGFKQGNNNFDSFLGKDGKTYFFDRKESIFGVRNANGTVATAYKPYKGNKEKALNYWNRKKSGNQ